MATNVTGISMEFEVVVTSSEWTRPLNTGVASIIIFGNQGKMET